MAYKWVRNWLTVSIGIILSILIFNFIVDPFEYYRKATFYKTYYDSNERYRNPGLIKNYEYSSVLIGSSMTQNFLISDLNKIIPNPIKLTARGMSPYEINIILNTVIKNKTNINKFLIGIDISTYFNKPESLISGAEIPYYLYDNNIYNDYKYLVNISTIKKSFNVLKKSINFINNDPLYKYEYMFQWEHLYKNKFGIKYKDMYNELNNKNNLKLKKFIYKDAKLNFDKNILNIIKKYPNKDYILFFPPYSALEYIKWKKIGIFEKYIKFKKYLYNVSLKNNNLVLYDFQVATKIILNFSKYKDLTHYNQSINTWMTDKINKKEYMVTDSSFNNNLIIMKKNLLLEY